MSLKRASGSVSSRTARWMSPRPDSFFCADGVIKLKLALPAGLFATAFICALAAVTALAVGVVIGLERFIGPLAAGFVGMLIFGAIAGGLGWYGHERLRRDF
jgi:hypothetical protein